MKLDEFEWGQVDSMTLYMKNISVEKAECHLICIVSCQMPHSLRDRSVRTMPHQNQHQQNGSVKINIVWLMIEPAKYITMYSIEDLRFF